MRFNLLNSIIISNVIIQLRLYKMWHTWLEYLTLFEEGEAIPLFEEGGQICPTH